MFLYVLVKVLSIIVETKTSPLVRKLLLLLLLLSLKQKTPTEIKSVLYSKLYKFLFNVIIPTVKIFNCLSPVNKGINSLSFISPVKVNSLFSKAKERFSS